MPTKIHAASQQAVSVHGRTAREREGSMAQLRADMPHPASPRVAGIAVSNPDRPIVEAPGHAKLDVVRYHERLAAWLLPQLAPRPIAVVKCMGGRFDDCFFQKHPLQSRDDDDSPPFMRLADTADIVRAVQNGTYEFHTWGASFPRLERPDRITLDLDPDSELPWPVIRAAAEHVRELLDRLELRWFLKTTGGEGLHFVLPITRRHTWLETRDFARAIADILSGEMPALFTSKSGKDARAGRVYVDYLRNAEGATAVAAYSLRARPGLPVSMPIAWSAIEDDVRGDYFNIDNAADAVAGRRDDPWGDYECSRQTLSASMRRAVHA
jgi:bifunctional non-homologous end joining protein LigD